MASASHIFPNCIGCKENMPNQHAHMHFGGGCLYQGDDDDEEEEELKLNQVTAKAKAKSDKKTKKSTTKPNGRANNDHH